MRCGRTVWEKATAQWMNFLSDPSVVMSIPENYIARLCILVKGGIIMVSQ